jgi:hypothetical protein
MSTGLGFCDRLPSLIQPVLVALVAEEDAEAVAKTLNSNATKASNTVTFRDDI